MPIVRSSHSKNAGFTLVEVALVVIIGGVLLTLFSGVLMNMIDESKIKTTNTRIQEVSDAIRRYASYNNHLPCAARTNVAPTNVSIPPIYGVALTSAECITNVMGTVRSGGVRIGMVPTRTLNLPDEYGYDGWGSRLTYAVTESMTDPATYNIEDGAVVIQGSPTNASFVVVSHGEDRKGAFNNNALANPPIPCAFAPAHTDLENCDNDATFVNTIHSYNSNNASFYDDYVSFQNLNNETSEIPEGAIVAFRLTTCPKGWDSLDAARGRFIMGAGQYVQTTAPNSNALTAYTGQNFESRTTGGFATRQDSPPTAPLGEYSNVPPYVAYLYCVKS